MRTGAGEKMDISIQQSERPKYAIMNPPEHHIYRDGSFEWCRTIEHVWGWRSASPTIAAFSVDPQISLNTRATASCCFGGRKPLELQAPGHFRTVLFSEWLGAFYQHFRYVRRAGVSSALRAQPIRFSLGSDGCRFVETEYAQCEAVRSRPF